MRAKMPYGLSKSILEAIDVQPEVEPLVGIGAEEIKLPGKQRKES
jgi:hypothetical protein